MASTVYSPCLAGLGGGRGYRLGSCIILRYISWGLLFILLCLVSSSRPNICHSTCDCKTKVIWQSVNCSDREFVDFPSELTLKESTTILDVSRNHIEVLQSHILGDFISLRYLNLANNQLSEIQRDAFSNLRHLTTAILSHNNLQKLDSDTFKSTDIQLLDLSFNNLILPSSEPFLKSETLLVLIMNNNRKKLEILPDISLTQLPKLQWLDISKNRLNRVPAKSLRALQALRSLNLDGNPLICDCELKDTRKWVSDFKVNMSHAVTCAEPSSMAGRPWTHLDDEECVNNAHSMMITAALCVIAAVLVVIAILVAIMVGQRRRHKRFRRKRGIPLPSVPSGEYIEVLPTLQNKENPYEEVGKKKQEDPSDKKEEIKDEKETPRYVTDNRRTVTDSTYVVPYSAGEKGPIYVNMLGPPLPLRRPSSDIGVQGLSAVTSGAPTTKASSTRRCSVPLLEGCDFYEVVD